MACSIYDKHIKVTTYKCSIKCYFILCCDFGTKNGPGCTQWNYPSSGWVTLKHKNLSWWTKPSLLTSFQAIFKLGPLPRSLQANITPERVPSS